MADGPPGLTTTADDVYARTYPRVRERVLDNTTASPPPAAACRPA
ncbi:hypothetical protein ACN9M0_35240 [Streptomyces sp. R-07]